MERGQAITLPDAHGLPVDWTIDERKRFALIQRYGDDGLLIVRQLNEQTRFDLGYRWYEITKP